MTLQEVIGQEHPFDAAAREAALRHWDDIAKPLHGLGRFEDVIAQIAALQGTPAVKIDRRALCVFCADNGVVAEGVTQTGQEVTAQVAENMLHGKATAAIFCEEVGAEIHPVDIGMVTRTTLPDRRIASGTRNFAKEPAMTREQAVRAIEVGISLACELADRGVDILATGEMGIGNTTTSSAVAAVLLQRPVEEMTGRGAGLSSAGLQTKIRVIEQALQLHRPNPDDAIDVLAKVGGFDIAGMAGVFLGGSARGIPVVIDGFISGVSALVASRIHPDCRRAMIASHSSKEPAAGAVLAALQKEATICADMMLGEGSGAMMLFPLLDMALSVYRKMPTFHDTDIAAYVPLV